MFKSKMCYCSIGLPVAEQVPAAGTCSAHLSASTQPRRKKNLSMAVMSVANMSTYMKPGNLLQNYCSPLSLNILHVCKEQTCLNDVCTPNSSQACVLHIGNVINFH